jgi:hypothetical protein
LVRSAATQNWIEAALALVVVGGCVLEGRNCKRRYHRERQPTYLDEAPAEPEVSALTRPSTLWAGSLEDEWSIDTHDELGAPLHACSRGDQCTHSRVQVKR